MLNNQNVAILCNSKLNYSVFPFLPNKKFPEINRPNTDTQNLSYECTRKLLFDLGLDKNNYNKPNWNPLGSLIKPGNTVIIKPNWVRDFNPINQNNIDSLITHTSIIKVVIDYILIALKSEGKIIIADAPVQNCDFNNLCNINNINNLIEQYKKEYKNIQFEIIDIRKTVALRQGFSTISTKDKQFGQKGDPKGYTMIDLAKDSFLNDVADQYQKFRITNYDHQLLEKHHNLKKHEYLISNSMLEADCIINLPKMKCHIKSGLTGALKNIVGINGHKEFLPHHINGSYLDGGDQYIHPSKIKEAFNKIYDSYWSEKPKRKLKKQIQFFLMEFLMHLSKIFDKDNLLDGSWQGNKTIPRTIIDLNHILYFYDHNTKKFAHKPIRKVLTIVDGVVAGEGNGPLTPRDRPVGILVAGFNPLLIDIALAYLMGYSPLEIPLLSLGIKSKRCKLLTNFDIDNYKLRYNDKLTTLNKLPNLHFIKPKHWEQAELK